MRARVVVAIGTLLVVALVMLWIVHATIGSSAYITEDDPRWNCRTMGNRICGPVEEQ